MILYRGESPPPISFDADSGSANYVFAGTPTARFVPLGASASALDVTAQAVADDPETVASVTLTTEQLAALSAPIYTVYLLDVSGAEETVVGRQELICETLPSGVA